MPNKRIKIVRYRSLGRRYRGAPYAGRYAQKCAEAGRPFPRIRVARPCRVLAEEAGLVERLMALKIPGAFPPCITKAKLG